MLCGASLRDERHDRVGCIGRKLHIRWLPVDIKIKASTCSTEVKAQTGLKAAALTNSGGHVDVTPGFLGIAYTVTQDGFLCPLTGIGSKTGATLTSASAFTVKGSNGAISVS